MRALAAATELLAAGFVAYVALRIGFVFFGGVGAAVALAVLGVAGSLAWRRGWTLALAGLAGGVVVSAAVLALS